MPSDACLEELETLSAIFLDEIVIGEANRNGEILVSMILFPSTADDEESRYVTLTIDVTLGAIYPMEAPKIRFRNPRGLSEPLLDDLMKGLTNKCEERLDSQMIYELIDMCKEFLTKNNRPSSECPICLLAFTEFDVFFRTKCFHHFHSHCLGNYLKSLITMVQDDHRADRGVPKKPELTCPVCRDLLDQQLDIELLIDCPPPSENGDEESEGADALESWAERKKVMERLFEKQKKQGGIIDLTDAKPLVISSPRRAPTDGGTTTGPVN